MVCVGKVIHAEKFTSRKNGKVYSKLFVPVGYEVVSVIAEGDLTDLAGADGVQFRLGLRDKELKLFYGGEEE